jgi:hypothetical protein
VHSAEGRTGSGVNGANMVAVFVCKKSLKSVDCVPYTIDGGCTPMREYYVFLSPAPIEAGRDMSAQVAQARDKYPDVVHTGDDGDSWTEWGKYSPDGMCVEPWSEEVL